MDPLIGGALIGAGAGIFDNIFNNKSNQRAYERDRADALSDWNRQNEYNSPKAQMARFKEAGLNPQLIYGQGTPGNASATPVSQQKSGNPSFKSNLQDIYGESIRLAQNMQQTQQTVENLKTNQELMQSNIELQNQMRDQRQKEFPFKLDKYDASIYAMNSSSDWKNKLLQPTIDRLTLNNTLGVKKGEREERLLQSNLNLNSSRNQQIQAQTALTVKLQAKTAQDIINKRNINDYQRAMLSEGLRKIQAETDAIIQGRATSISVEQLNKVNRQLKEWEETYKPVKESTEILKNILSPFNTKSWKQQPIRKPQSK